MTPIPTITAGHSLFPASFTRISNRSPYGSPAQWAEIRAYRVPIIAHGWVRFCLFTGDKNVDAALDVRGQTCHAPFWLKPVSDFGSVRLTVFISSSLTLTVPPSLAPQPPCRWQYPPVTPHGKQGPQMRGYIVRELGTPPLPVTHDP